MGSISVVFALKNCRVLLLSKISFTVLTDHQALHYAFKKKDLHGRLARWMERIIDNDFETRYLPGASNGAAD